MRIRWVIIGLVFLATLINYIDRLTISVLAPVITKDLGLTNLEFGSIATWFLLAYTVSQALSGRLYDRIGTKLGFTLSITVWSLAAMATATARSLTSLSIFRFILGAGEAGNWPGAAKAIAEWFPVRERAFAMAIFNSGAALGAVVAPPDAAAATAVLRHLRPPHRILTILEGESLLNDASALLIYRLAVGAVAANGFSIAVVAPTFLFAVAGSLVVGPVLAWLFLRLMERVQHVPTAIILQFVSTFGVWILADRIGLSGVLTMVCYAIAVARSAPELTPARVRIPSYAVWETVVFVLNILAFIFIGLQIRPILDSLDPAARGQYFAVAGAVLVTVIVVRVVWHMSFNGVIRWRDRRHGFHPPRPMLRPTVGSGLIISWAGMRGIVTLAAALALPAAFPFRDLIVLTAFGVVLGTLTLQGLTLKPLLRALDLRDDDPVGQELTAARERALRAGLASFEHDRSSVAETVRQEFTTHLAAARADTDAGDGSRPAFSDLHRGAVRAARQAVLAMRSNDEIGDDAFHQIEEELDWFEMGGSGKEG
jgi:CPA1 family monovalent cation:H+ antiporter